MRSRKFGLRQAAGLVVLVLSGCIIVPPDVSGACVTHDPAGPGYWCDDDYEADTCDVAAADFVQTFYAGQGCIELGYAYYCSPEEMAASGGPAYVVGRVLGNAACDASLQPGEVSSSGGSCVAANGICTDSVDPAFASGCDSDPDNPGNVFTAGGTCADTGVSCTGGEGNHPVTGAPMQIDVYYPPELCGLVRDCSALLGGTGVGGC